MLIANRVPDNASPLWVVWWVKRAEMVAQIFMHERLVESIGVK
jgi:hypothetical protein